MTSPRQREQQQLAEVSRHLTHITPPSSNDLLSSSLHSLPLCLQRHNSPRYAVPCCVVQVVSKDIRRILSERAHYFNIVLEDVSITNLTFSKEYTAAVEAKQVAQQEAERAKFIVSGGPTGAEAGGRGMHLAIVYKGWGTARGWDGRGGGRSIGWIC